MLNCPAKTWEGAKRVHSFIHSFMHSCTYFHISVTDNNNLPTDIHFKLLVPGSCHQFSCGVLLPSRDFSVVTKYTNNSVLSCETTLWDVRFSGHWKQVYGLWGCNAFTFNFKMKEAGFSRTLPSIYQSKWHNITKDSYLDSNPLFIHWVT